MELIETKPTTRRLSTPRQKVPEALIYEMWDGKPIYYAGYRDVMKGIKQAEQIMGLSYLQSSLVDILLEFLYSHPNKQNWKILSNELGVLLKKKSWRSCDIAIYEKAQLKDVPVTDHYLNVPPKVVIEVDTKADLTQFKASHDYFFKKTDQLLAFGVEKVIWIFTKEPRRILVAEQGVEEWLFKTWSQEINIMPDCSFVLENLQNQS